MRVFCVRACVKDCDRLAKFRGQIFDTWLVSQEVDLTDGIRNAVNDAFSFFSYQTMYEVRIEDFDLISVTNEKPEDV